MTISKLARGTQIGLLLILVILRFTIPMGSMFIYLALALSFISFSVSQFMIINAAKENNESKLGYAIGTLNLSFTIFVMYLVYLLI